MFLLLASSKRVLKLHHLGEYCLDFIDFMKKVTLHLLFFYKIGLTIRGFPTLYTISTYWVGSEIKAFKTVPKDVFEMKLKKVRPVEDHFWPFFCKLYEYISQN